MSQSQVLKLYQQLLQFGLNPHEWVINPVEPKLFEISKIDDPEFKLLGTIENLKWTQIWVTSI